MTHHDTDVVSSFRLEIARQISQDRFDLWFADTEIEVDEASRVARIVASHTLALDWLRTNFRQHIQVACELVFGNDWAIQYSARSEESSAAAVSPRAITTELDATQNVNGPNSKTSGSSRAAVSVASARRKRFARFDDFVVGACNQVAFTSARLASDRLGETSPFFVYGPTGVGKSHLLQSMVTAVRRQSTRRRCVHLSAEQFTHGFVQALRGHGLPSFRRRHREVDLLVIEDVHFLEGKRATISELAYTIDAVANEGGQLAFSSQLPPAELGSLGEDLVNRFCGGLLIRMQPADRPTREALLRSLAQKKGLTLSDGVIRLIAERVLDDVRKLQGAINQLSALQHALNCEITESNVAETLKPYFSSAPKNLSLRDIEKAVCDVFSLESRKLKSESRTQRISGPRMLAMFLARKYTRAALSEIGEHFGRRSHSSVIAADKKIKRLMREGSIVAMADKQCSIDEAVRQVEFKLRAC